jgi:ATP-dependent DNA helicase RecQ
MTEAQWRAVLRQLITLRLVAVDHDNWNVLRLAEASREVLRGERRLTLRREAASPPGGRKARRGKAPPAPQVPASPAEEVVFQALREWRRGVAKEHGVPAYTVLHDASLREIAQRLPDNAVALGGISGVGATKLARYGTSIVDVVKAASSG